MLAGRSGWVATVHNVLIKVMLVCCSGGLTENRNISLPPKCGFISWGWTSSCCTGTGGGSETCSCSPPLKTVENRPQTTDHYVRGPKFPTHRVYVMVGQTSNSKQLLFPWPPPINQFVVQNWIQGVGGGSMGILGADKVYCWHCIIQNCATFFCLKLNWNNLKDKC